MVSVVYIAGVCHNHFNYLKLSRQHGIIFEYQLMKSLTYCHICVYIHIIKLQQWCWLKSFLVQLQDLYKAYDHLNWFKNFGFGNFIANGQIFYALNSLYIDLYRGTFFIMITPLRIRKIFTIFLIHFCVPLKCLSTQT